MSQIVRSKPRTTATKATEKTAITLRLDEDLHQIVHLVAGERRQSLNEAAQYIISDWWERKPERDRERYEQFLGRPLRRK